MDSTLTPAERTAIRLALGLPNARKRSVYNCQFIGRGPLLPVWNGMVAKGLAVQVAKTDRLTEFVATRAGAERALEPGEALTSRHFPIIGQD